MASSKAAAKNIVSVTVHSLKGIQSCIKLWIQVILALFYTDILWLQL